MHTTILHSYRCGHNPGERVIAAVASWIRPYERIAVNSIGVPCRCSHPIWTAQDPVDDELPWRAA
jgi:hypothetical protein